MSMVHCGIYGYGVNIEGLTWKKVKDIEPDRVKKIFDPMSDISEEWFAEDVKDNLEMRFTDFVREFLDEYDVFCGILGPGAFDYVAAEDNRYILHFPSFEWQPVDGFKSEADARFYLWCILEPYIDMSKEDFCSKFGYIDDYYFG